MPRHLRSLSLLALLGLGAPLARAAEVDYFLPVTCTVVISRPVIKTNTEKELRTTLTEERLTTRDLLREVLKSHGIKNASNWSLVARGNSAAFADDPRTTDTLSSLQIVARNSKTKEIKTIPDELALGFTRISDTCAYGRTERQRVDAAEIDAPQTLVSSSTTLSREVEFTQKLEARGSFPAGTVTAAGGMDYTTTYGPVSVGKQSTGNAVLRPTRATFRAIGSYVDTAGDGIAEVVITLGTPSYVIVGDSE